MQIDTIYQGDCLELMKELSDKSIDMVLCDLPYETTVHAWDKIIPFDLLWEQYNRVIKDDGVIVLFATQPFTTYLMSSNMKMWRYNWIWQKDSTNGFLNANYAPLKTTEDICVFSKATVGSLSKNKIRYYPQGVRCVNKTKYNNKNDTYRQSQGYASSGNKLNSGEKYVQKYENYPTNILYFPHDKDVLHPTQKPIDLLRYLILTYTKEGEVVLDNTCGSGSTCVAAHTEHRHYIGMELTEKYYNIASKRMSILQSQKTLF